MDLLTALLEEVGYLVLVHTVDLISSICLKSHETRCTLQASTNTNYVPEGRVDGHVDTLGADRDRQQ